MAKNVIVNFCSDEDKMLSVEVIKDISNWNWLIFLFTEGSNVNESEVKDAVDFWAKTDTQEAIVNEENYEECCKKFADAVQSVMTELGGEEMCSIQFVSWSVEYDTNLACIISNLN